jgi:hypothetical protein
VAASKALLAKIIPDVTAVKVGGDAENPVRNEVSGQMTHNLVIRWEGESSGNVEDAPIMIEGEATDG